jgi:hypothetical protein
MGRIKVVLVVALGMLAGCSKPLSAMDACRKLEQAGVAAGCREDKPEGLGASAIEKATFDLPSVPGKGGQVLRFGSDEAFRTTSAGFEKLALFAGPHRYGSPGTRIFVQFNNGASLEVGKKARSVIEGL